MTNSAWGYGLKVCVQPPKSDVEILTPSVRVLEVRLWVVKPGALTDESGVLISLTLFLPSEETMKSHVRGLQPKRGRP